jgi:hypothetical protein
MATTRYAIIEIHNLDSDGRHKRRIPFLAPEGAGEPDLRAHALEKAEAEIFGMPTGGGLKVRVLRIEPLD